VSCMVFDANSGGYGVAGQAATWTAREALFLEEVLSNKAAHKYQILGG
jgi:hypothetical protein